MQSAFGNLTGTQHDLDSIEAIMDIRMIQKFQIPLGRMA